MTGVRPAALPEDLELIRLLFREYQQSVDAPVCFTTFDRELAALPEGYLAFWIAELDDRPAGCAALRDLGADCELKRLFVRPEARGAGFGRRMVEAGVAAGAARGYRRLVLDTLPMMTGAIRLYRTLGFREIAPYNSNAFPGTLFFALDLPASFA
jgi:carbonic anhydrase